MFRITAAVREYFNYRYDRASLRLEEARLNGLRDLRSRDFRSRKQREEDRNYEARADSETEGSGGGRIRSCAGGSVK
jgi:hypothetical protein